MRKKKAIKQRKPRVIKCGIATGSSPAAKRSRKRAIVRRLKPLQGSTVRNIAMNKDVYITANGFKETAFHGSRTELSTIAALDAKRQLRSARPVAKIKAKKNGMQKAMHLVTMTKMKNSIAGHPTKVNVGNTGSGYTVLYSITAKRRKRK